MEWRINDPEIERLFNEAKRRGIDPVEVVREALRSCLPPTEVDPEPPADEENKQDEPSDQEVIEWVVAAFERQGADVQNRVRAELTEQLQKPEHRRQTLIGFKNKVWVADDFDETPEWLIRLFEGEEDEPSLW